MLSVVGDGIEGVFFHLPGKNCIIFLIGLLQTDGCDEFWHMEGFNDKWVTNVASSYYYKMNGMQIFREYDRRISLT